MLVSQFIRMNQHTREMIMGIFNITVVSKHTIRTPQSTMSFPSRVSVSNMEATSFYDALIQSQDKLQELETFAVQQNNTLSGQIGAAQTYEVVAYCVEDKEGGTRFFDLKYQQMAMLDFLHKYANCMELQWA